MEKTGTPARARVLLHKRRQDGSGLTCAWRALRRCSRCPDETRAVYCLPLLSSVALDSSAPRPSAGTGSLGATSSTVRPYGTFPPPMPAKVSITARTRLWLRLEGRLPLCPPASGERPARDAERDGAREPDVEGRMDVEFVGERLRISSSCSDFFQKGSSTTVEKGKM